MGRAVKYSVLWSAIALSIGAVGHFAIGLDFWISTLIAGLALIINGVIAELEEW